jgi:predicted TIM-barrel fold metal-dependent hydrolase
MTGNLSIPITTPDLEFYASRVRNFLPDRIVDIHAHVWTQVKVPGTSDPSGRSASWPSRVAASNPIEDLLATYGQMLPGKQVTPVIFSSPTVSVETDELNRYVADCAAAHGLPALLLSRPEWSAEELGDRLAAGGFAGIKPYLSFAPPEIPVAEVEIFDFLPRRHLELLNEIGGIVMLHIPRPGRLGDPVNLAQMMEIDREYPNAKVIIAHVGRAYCVEDIGGAFDALTGARNLLFDISANTNEEVFRRLIRTVGPRRILFGSDMPILRMRTRRICEDGVYVNLVPKGLYGDISGDPHMREIDGDEADRMTFFLYEEIDAFRRAAEAEGLTRAEIEAVFHDSAATLRGGP